MPRGIQPTDEDLRAMGPYRSVVIAAECDPPLNRRTVERAKARENVHPMCLRMIREALAKLATQPAAPVRVSPNVPNQAAAQ